MTGEGCSWRGSEQSSGHNWECWEVNTPAELAILAMDEEFELVEEPATSLGIVKE